MQAETKIGEKRYAILYSEGNSSGETVSNARYQEEGLFHDTSDSMHLYS